MNSKSWSLWSDPMPDNRKSNSGPANKSRKLAGLVALALTFGLGGAWAWAQQTRKVARIGYLDNSTASGSAVVVEAFRQELRKLGWIEGKNIIVEYRFAAQKNKRLPELAADLVRLKVDLIVVSERSSRTRSPDSHELGFCGRQEAIWN